LEIAQPPAPTPQAQQVIAPPAEVDVIAIEKTPGLTPAFADGTIATPPSDASLPGRAGPSPAMGPDDAPVVVFVFSDFQCPVCRRGVEPLKKLVRDHDPLVRVVFKHQALASHPDARGAAIASLAAFRQDKFWQYHDRLFASAAGLGDDALKARAEEVGLDVTAFKAAQQDEALGAQVDYETALGTALGVRGTPGFLVNGALSIGWGSYLSLNQKVKEAIVKWRESGKPASSETARTLTALEDPRAAEGLFPTP